MAHMRKRLRTCAAAAVLALSLGTPLAVTTAHAAPATTQSTPLPPDLEQIRAAEATKLYGSPEERPMADRKSEVISLGDSEISGEGVGSYWPGTDGPDNWCHRSTKAAIYRTGLADVANNVACSGAATYHIRIGGQKQYADQLVQSDNLAIKARNTRVKMIVLVVGANDDIQFGPVMTDCVERWVLLQGPCAPKYDSGWQARVDGMVPKVEATVGDLKTVMREAGYADDAYKLVVMSYPSPISPDMYDNPNFPGKLPGGCLGYDSDAAWGRNVAVPAFERGIRKAAEASGAYYLDNSRLFHGHEVCTSSTWARGFYYDVTGPFPPDENNVRQSFHPNAAGHGAFASCFAQFYNSGLREASCADPASTGSPKLYAGAWDDLFKPLKNEATGQCLDASGDSSRNGTSVIGWDCHGGRNQVWWYDPAYKSIHVGLSHDRCLDSRDTTAGTSTILWNCHGGTNQQWTRPGDGTIRPATATGLCLTQSAANGAMALRSCDGSTAQRFA
ncbi:ricin-type beta-trefoil lectin domain protein [Streptomyces beihaiensis]|uniref:Ricin-type beta-trefoil lectin domain protein n=1 Tax=Streptomyces beihaiensis TaxID=2984495 RepID=A0ABT3TUB2_9ACTN|nr:ricin-type beta-trefoil lectin domain protein [Streptomyces beihaiensis]MCX3060619.1 ricin-type beta-trefoil lectin domain protein [Streptomyces beihaiensis]